jgi:hypothetical protein
VALELRAGGQRGKSQRVPSRQWVLLLLERMQYGLRENRSETVPAPGIVAQVGEWCQARAFGGFHVVTSSPGALARHFFFHFRVSAWAREGAHVTCIDIPSAAPCLKTRIPRARRLNKGLQATAVRPLYFSPSLPKERTGLRGRSVSGWAFSAVSLVIRANSRRVCITNTSGFILRPAASANTTASDGERQPRSRRDRCVALMPTDSLNGTCDFLWASRASLSTLPNAALTAFRVGSTADFLVEPLMAYELRIPKPPSGHSLQTCPHLTRACIATSNSL